MSDQMQRIGSDVASVSTLDSEAIAETLVALANTNGGRLIVNWQWKLPQDARMTITQIAAACQPAVALDGFSVSDTVITIHISRSRTLHALADGRIMGRFGIENRELGGEAIRRLARAKSADVFDGEPVPGTRLSDLDFDLVGDYVKKRNMSSPNDTHEVLLEIGAINVQRQPTVAGILLFESTPKRWMASVGVVLKRFAGSTLSPIRIVQEREFDGALSVLIDQVCSCMEREMGLSSSYPAPVLREAVINAILHRDYRLRDRITVNIDDDHVEVISPGELPGFSTLDTLHQQHYWRNPRLVNTLSQWGYTSGMGVGIDQMKCVMQDQNLMAPD